MIARRALAALALLTLVAGASQAARQPGPVTVVTALQPLYSIATALAQGTAITVKPVPATLPGMGQVTRILARANRTTDQTLEAADVVVAIASIWPEDPLFREARARNIWVVEIDAARPLGKGQASVALIAKPVTDVPWREAETGGGDSPYVWFSPANAIRMAEIVATDFKRLAPDGAAAIETNLAAFTREFLGLKAEYEAKFLKVADPRVLSLTDRFAYLTNEAGVFVDGYFLEDDVRWTDADYAGFTRLLREREITRVLHHWEPSEGIMAAIAAAGAKLVILNDGETEPAPGAPDPRGYQTMLRANLETLHRGFAD